MNPSQTSRQGDAAQVRMDDGAIIMVRRWGEPAAQRMVISHGNGLAIDAFATFGEALLAKGFEVIAFDMRNHGRNPNHAASGDNWERFISDFPQILAAIDADFGEKPAHGAFHSLSSAVCLLSQVRAPYPWQSLTLFEPPIPAAEGTELNAEFLDYHAAISARAANRRSSFQTTDELAKSMRRSSLFRLISDDGIDFLARSTLRSTDGRWTLCCPPDFEAATFRIDSIVKLRPGIGRVRVPVRVVVGDLDHHYAGVLVNVGRDLCRDFGFDLVELPNATHFMQLEAPELCAHLAAGGEVKPPGLEARPAELGADGETAPR